MVTNQDVADAAFGVTGPEQRHRREVRCWSASAPLPLGSPLRTLGSPLRTLVSPVRAKRRTPRRSVREGVHPHAHLSGAREASHAPPPRARRSTVAAHLSGAREASHATPQRARRSTVAAHLSGAREASHATPQRARRSTAACPSLRCSRSVARHAPACAKEYSRMPRTKTSDKSWKTRSRSSWKRRPKTQKLTEQAHAISKRRRIGHDGTDLR